MTELRISPDLSLPMEFATEGVAVIGMRGSGKSNTEVRFAELLYGAGSPFVVIDPKGDWHGIRSSADGTKPGLSVPVFGGLHQDFPLEPGTGARIADLLVDNMLSAVLDASALSKTGDLPAFLTAFCNQLMHRHQLEPHVRTVILEEAHRYIPQNVKGEKAVVKEAAASLLLEGRAFGLGCWAATQRPARINKDVLEEVGTAIIHRIGVAASNDKKTIAGWVEHHELSKEIVDSLTKLRDGEAWVLLPDLGVIKRVQMDRRTTFDSAATPKVGAAPRRPSTMADIDQAAIKEALADVIERAKADDPKELRKRIAQLERELRERPTEPVVETITEQVEVPVLSDDVRRQLGDGLALLNGAVETLGGLGDRLRDGLALASVGTREQPLQRTERAPESPKPRVSAPPRRDTPASHDSTVTGPMRKLLAVLATYGARTKRQLAMQAGYSAKGGGFNNPLSALRSSGLVKRGDPIAITQAGLDALGDFEPLPTGQALIDHWMGQLSGPERKILQPLIDAHPATMTKEALAEAAGYAPVGGGFNNPLSRLRTLELVTRGPEIGLTEDFAEAIE